MRPGRQLKALDVPEERALAGKLAGLLYVTAAAGVLLLLVLPGVPHGEWGVVVAVAGVALAWALVCFTVIPWDRAPPAVSHFSTGLGIVLTAIAASATGGADSPARFYLLFCVLYSAYFYPVREAVPHWLACIGALALPVLYQPDAIEDGLLGELIVMGPIYFALGLMISMAKRGLIDLRLQALTLSLTDVLTGVANRRALMDRLEAHVGGKRTDDAIGLLLVDLDALKSANTLFGHPGGDAVLREAARALTRSAREGDLVGRLGGDEFAIVVGRASDEGMRTLAERVLAAVRAGDERLALPGFRFTVSIGWAIHPENGATVDELLAAADLALGGAKVAGKNRSLGCGDTTGPLPAAARARSVA